MRTCPRCQSNLSVTDYEGVQIDRCGRCGGEWLDAGELRQILDAREREWDAGDLEGMRQAVVRRVPLRAVRERLTCPSCGQTMQPFNYGGDTGIILDKCGDCGGVWFDGGELAKVQQVIEAWEGTLGDDFKHYGVRMTQVARREEERARRDSLSTPWPGASALVNRIFDI